MIQLVVLLSLVLLLGLATKRIMESLSVSAAARQNVRRGLLWGAVLVGLALAATGRLVILIPLVGALIAAVARSLPLLIPLFLQYRPLWKRWKQQERTARESAAGGPSVSTVESRYLRMRLDHGSGQISGEIIYGRFAGRCLSELNQAQLSELYADCVRSDRESASLLRAYLERVYGGDWNAEAGRRDGRQPETPATDRMTAEEAHEVLGLQPGASRDQIIAAHRRLMQKLHPDRGGSDYLAAKINQAKSILLG